MVKKAFSFIDMWFIFLAFGASLAQEKYPNRPIELVVPNAPGGSSDITARVYSEELTNSSRRPSRSSTGVEALGFMGRLMWRKRRRMATRSSIRHPPPS